MLQPRRGEAVQSRRPRDNGLIYTTLIVFLSVATFNYAVGLAVAEGDISNQGQSKEATISSTSSSVEAIVGAVENGPLNHHSNEQPDDVTHSLSDDNGERRHNKKLVPPILGLVSTTERTFIDNGVTTQYGTAVYGTEIKNGEYYVQFLTTNTKILYENQLATKSAAEELKRESSSAAENIFNGGDDFDIGNVHTILIQPKSPLPAYLDRTRATPALDEDNTEAEVVTSVVTSSSSSSSSSSSNKKDGDSAEKKKGKSLNLLEEEKSFRFNEILPTFTVAQEGILYETASPSLNADAQTTRNNKALEVDNFFVGSELQAANEAAGANNEAIGELKSTTYFGFSEFTTTVGDTRIVFLPSSQTPEGRDGIANNINIAPTATWTSEVKSVDASVMNLPQAKFKPKVKLPSFKGNPFKTTTTTTEKPPTTTTTEKNIEENEIIQGEKKYEEAEVRTETTTTEEPTEPPKILSTPTNEDILKIFNSLKMAEMERERSKLEEELLGVNVPETTSIEETSSATTASLIEATPASKETLINSGVTTIFFEPDFEDPFAVIEREEQEKREQQVKQTTEDELNTTTEDSPPTTLSEEVSMTSTEEEATTLKLETTSKAAESVPTTEKEEEAEEEITMTPEESTTIGKSEAEEDEVDKCANLIITTTIPTFKTVTLLTTLLPDERVETNVVTSTELNKLTITPAIYLDLGCQATTLAISSTTSKAEEREEQETTTAQKPETETMEISTEKVDKEEDDAEKEPEPVVEKPMRKKYSSIDRQRPTTESSESASSTSGGDLSLNVRFNTDEVTENVLEIVTEKKHVTSSSDEEVTERASEVDATTVSEEPAEEEESDNENVIWKTLYTTYTYLTTFFQESTSSVSSRKEIVTNIVKSTMAAADASRMGLEFIEATPTDNVGVGRPTILAFDQFDALFGSTNDEEDDSVGPAGEGVDSGNGIKTYYTTYTYFTTIFVDGETEVSSRTEVYTNFVTPTKVQEGDMMTTPPATVEEVEESLINENRVGKSYNTMIRKIDEDVDALEAESGTDKASEESVTKMVTNTRNSTSKVNNIVEMVADPQAQPIADQDESESKNYEKKLNGVFLDSSEQEIRPTALALTDSNEELNANKTTTLLLQTSYTTFTYYTTMYIGTEASNVLSRLETVTNFVTETLKEPSPTETTLAAELKTKLNEIDNKLQTGDNDALPAAEELDKNLPITYFTTFTYWTTIFKDGNTVTTSREETVSNVIEPTSTVENVDLKTVAAKVLRVESDNKEEVKVKEEEVQSKPIESSGAESIASLPSEIKPTSITTFYTTYTYYTTSYIGEETVLNSHFETVTNVHTPDLTPTSTTGSIAPSSRALKLGETIEDVPNELDDKSSSVEASSSNTPPLEDFVNTANLLRINYGRIVDSENISTIHYKTLTLATTIDNIQAEVLQSTRSIEVDEKRKAQLATVEKDSGNLKTGLVRLIDGTIVNKNATNVLTQYLSKIIGTVIDGRYAQIIESRTDIVTATATKSTPLQTAVVPVKVPQLESSKGQSKSPQKTNAHDEEETTEENENGEGDEEDEEEDEDGKPKSRLSFQQRKKTFTPIIRPFASRNRPTFAPKRKQLNTNAGPQTVTRSDVTPTITATPALSNSPSNIRTRLRGSSSKQFAYRSSSSGSNPSSASSGGPSSTRGRFTASRSTNSVRITPTLSRPGLLRSSLGGQQRSSALLTPSSRINRFRSSAFGGISASRTEHILKTKAVSTTTTEQPSDNDSETATDVVEESAEETKVPETTTPKNPLLNRFRRPSVSSLRVGPRTTTTTTTTTPKPKRAFKRPPVLSFQPSASPAAASAAGNVSPSERFSRTRTNSLFPARGFLKQSTTTTEAPEPEEDEDFVDEEGEQTLSRKKRQLYHSRLRTTPTQKPAARKKYEEEYEYIEYYDDEPVVTTPKRPTSRGSSFRNRNPVTQSPPTTQRATTLRASNIRASNPQNFRQPFTIRDNSFYKPATTPAPVVTTPSRKRPSLGGARNNRVSTTRKTTPTSRTNRLRSNTNLGSSNNSYKSGYNRNSPTTRTSNSRGSTSGGRPRARNNFNQNIGPTNTFVDNPYLDSTAVTVTHYVPSEVTVPYQNPDFPQRTEYKTIVTQKQSTEVIPRKNLKTYQNTLFLNKESTLVNPLNGATEVVQYYLKEKETTTVVFTPTTIRGRRTSYSHVVPSTVYNVEMTTVTQVPSLADSIGNPAAPLANILLSQLLLGNLGGGAGNNLNQNLGIPGLNPLAGLQGQAQIDTKPQTEYKTRTTTYVTTLTDQKSTVLPLTFHGKQILTTIYDNSQNVITATEFITDTIVITPTQVINPIQQTQPQFNSLLLPLLLQQQQQQQQQQALTQQAPQQETLQQQLAQLLPKDNFVDTNEQVQSHEEDEPQRPAVAAAKKSPSPPALKPKKIVPQNTEIITLYVSGRKPGEFSTVLSTIISGGGEENIRRRRDTDPEEFDVDQTPELEATETAFTGHHIRTRALGDLVQIDSTNTILYGVERPSEGPERIYQTAEHFLA